jgi:hypothetical protein
MLVETAVSAFQRATLNRGDASGLAATEEVLKTVSQIRHLQVKSPVKSSAKTKDEIEQFVIRDLDENTPHEEFAATEKVLIKLGLVPKGFALREYIVKLLREQVAGFYDPKTREFYLAAWLPLGDQKKVMAHELVHALQDQHFNLRRFEKWPKGDSDAELAVHALIEGDATMLMIQYEVNQQSIKLDITRLPSLTDTMLAENSDDDSEYPVLAAAPRVLRETLQFPYIYGAGFAQAVWRDRTVDGLNRTYTDLPVSSEQIMHPAKFINRENPTKIELPDLRPVLGSSWKRLDRDVSGEFGYLVLLTEFIEKGRARTASEGWAGDAYALYEDAKSGALMLAQLTTWDSPVDAREFFNAYADRTLKRYKLGLPRPKTDRVVYETAEGLASIELRNRDVLIVEGLNSALQLAAVEGTLWGSKKAPR